MRSQLEFIGTALRFFIPIYGIRFSKSIYNGLIGDYKNKGLPFVLMFLAWICFLQSYIIHIGYLLVIISIVDAIR